MTAGGQPDGRRAMRQLGGHYLGPEELAAAGFAKLGRNVRIHSLASIYGTENVSLGDDVRIDDFCIVIATGPVRFGNHVALSAQCYVGGTCGVTLEDFVTFAPGVRLFSASDDYSGEHLCNPTIPKDLVGGARGPVTLGRHVIIGANSVVLPDLTVGEGCSVGGLSLVKRSLEPWGIYAGVPVRRVGARSQRLLEGEKLLRAREVERS
jgi:acetyltransferase-like isoleucine patch superfamily enzyme